MMGRASPPAVKTIIRFVSWPPNIAGGSFPTIGGPTYEHPFTPHLNPSPLSTRERGFPDRLLLGSFLQQQPHIIQNPFRTEKIEIVNLPHAAAHIEQEDTRGMIELSARSRSNPHAPIR